MYFLKISLNDDLKRTKLFFFFCFHFLSQIIYVWIRYCFDHIVWHCCDDLSFQRKFTYSSSRRRNDIKLNDWQQINISVSIVNSFCLFVALAARKCLFFATYAKYNITQIIFTVCIEVRLFFLFSLFLCLFFTVVVKSISTQRLLLSSGYTTFYQSTWCQQYTD